MKGISNSSVLPIAAIMSMLLKSTLGFKAHYLKYDHRLVNRRQLRQTYAPCVTAPTSLRSGANTMSNVPKYHMFRAIRLFSTAVETTQRIPSSALHTVMVHRNKQSLAFREGTPLVFTKSIAATYSEILGDDAQDIDDIPLGSLVAVVVKREKSQDKGSRKGKPKNASAMTHSHFTFQDDEEHKQAVSQSQLIGYGVYNPRSMYRVRMLLHESIHPGLSKQIRSMRKEIQKSGDKDQSCQDSILSCIVKKKIMDAMHLRTAMNLPSATTDTYRLVNGEGDGLSGLAVDIIGGSTAIIMSSAAWVEIHKNTILSALTKVLAEYPSCEPGKHELNIVWRNTPSRLLQDGYEVQKYEKENEDVPVVATESSIKYLTYPYSDGQKTGFYCDQRDNRKMIAKYCENKRILDLCCYSGGFCLNAVIHGNAASALGVDSSQDAVDAAIANAKLNGLEDSKISFVRDDIASFMKSAIESHDEYDIVILDPPKLAPSISTLTKASRKYHSLNRDAMNLINKSHGGLLLTCTCSAAMTQSNGGQLFLSMVNSAALSSKRQSTLLSVTGASPCHTQSPASFPAGNYLTCALFFVGPVES